jgi:hypothetical protein
VRALANGLTLELMAGEEPAMLLVQGEEAVRIPLAQAKALVAALADGAADLAEVLATGGVYHA